MKHLFSIVGYVERHGLKTVLRWMLALGVVLSFILYFLPPIFEAAGEIAAFEIRDLHAHTISPLHK